MYKKRLVAIVLVFLLVMPFFVIAENEEQSSCSGFWGSLSCFFWGNPENRAGKGWFERDGKVVGEST